MSIELRAAVDIDRELKERSREQAAKSNQLHSLYTGTRTEDGKRVMHAHQAEEIARLERELSALGPVINGLKWDWGEANNRERMERATSDSPTSASIFDGRGGMGIEGGCAPGAHKASVRLPDSMGDAFIEGQAYKSWNRGGANQTAWVEVETLNFREYARREAIKATLATATGPFTSIDKLPEVVMLGQQQLTVADLLSTAQTQNTTVRYIQEDTFTNTAAMVAEEGQKPEASWDLSEVDATVKKIAWLARTTTEMMEDYTQIRDYVNQRLPFGVRQREELQLISGDGTGNNLLGVLSVPGTLTVAKGTNNNIDALYLGITAVRTQGFFEPDAILIHPSNWSAIRLLKTTQGEYEYGHPAVPGPETIFGKRVVITVNCPANTAVVGAWKIGGTIYYRQGIRVEATNSDASDFAFNRVAIRAEQREAAAWFRPKAFCRVTGLDALP